MNATDFLLAYAKDWQAEHWLNLCAIQPDNAAPLVGRSWPAADLAEHRGEIAAWIEARNAEGRGVYFTANPLSRCVHGKPADADVAVVTTLNIDADPDVALHGGYAAARAALLAAVAAREAAGGPVPSFTVDSGNGMGLFFVLAEPLGVAAGRAAGKALQGEARRLMPGAKVDSTADPSRLMRLPGTRNWPSAKKIGRGYPAGDAAPWASVASTGGGRLALAAVAEATAADDTPPKPETLLAPSPEVLGEALAWVANEGSREHWVAVGAALKGAGGTEEQWLEWSGTGQGQAEDPADIATRWKGFGQPRIGWGAIEGWARAGGWGGGADLDFAAFGKLAEEMGGDDTLQARAFKEWRWVRSIERFGNIVTGEVMSRLNFSIEHNWWGPPLSSSGNAAAQFLKDARCVKLVGMTYLPGGPREVFENVDRLIGMCLNTWRPSLLVPLAGATDADIEPWLSHIEAMIPDRETRERLFDYMAFLLQKQAEKPNYGPLMLSKPGSGKDFLLWPLCAALGWHNVGVVSVRDIESEFNDWASGKRLVIFNEAHSTGRVKQADILKPHMAAPPRCIAINRKGLARVEEPNRHAMWLFSNRADAVQIEDEDRRYWVVSCKLVARPDGWWRARWEWMETGGGEAAVAGWLMARDISGFDAKGRAPDSEAKKQMQIDTMTDWQAAVRDGLEAGDWPDLVNPGDIAARLNAAAGARGRGFTGKLIGMALRAAGAEPVHGGEILRLAAPCFTGSERVRLVSIRNHDSYSGMPPAALARNFTAGWARFDDKAAAEFKPYAVSVPPGDSLL